MLTIVPQLAATKIPIIPAANPDTSEIIISLCSFIKFAILMKAFLTLSANSSTFPANSERAPSCSSVLKTGISIPRCV